MRKSLLVLALAPLLSFGVYLDDDSAANDVSLVRVYTFVEGSTDTIYQKVNASSPSSVYTVYASCPFGLLFHRDTLQSPSKTSSTNDCSDSSSLDYQVRLRGLSNKFFSPRCFSSVDGLFTFAYALFVQQYQGPGFKLCYTDGTRTYWNFDYKTVVADILSSTNTVYRQLLLSHLSSISSGVNSISSSVSDLPRLVDLYSDVNQFNTANVSSLVVSAYNFNWIRQTTRDMYLEDLADAAQNYGPDQLRLVESNIRGALSSLGLGAGLVNGLAYSTAHDPRTADGLDSIGSQFNRGVSDILNGGGSGGGGIAGDVKRLTTNDWTKGVRDQLRDNHDNITNRLAHMFDDTPNSAGRAIRQTADNTAVSAARAADIASKLNGVLHVQVDNPNNIGVVLDGPVTFDTTQFNGVSVPLAGVKDKIDTWYDNWYSFWDISNPAVSWANFYNMLSDFKTRNHSDLSAITNSLRGVFSVTGDVSRIYDYLSGPQSNLLAVIASSITNNWDDYYFRRFRRANEFNDEDDQPFTLECASQTVFGRGFDEGEYSRLNWFSRVELLLFQLSAVSSGTNALESVDIEDDLNYTVDSFNQHGQDFVNASRRVVGLFQLIDGFAASMRAAFGSYSNPVTRGITLLPAGSWIGDNALVLEVSVTIQNALRLVFQCIWYLSAFVVAWRVVVSTWSRVVSFVRWLWSVFDI